MCPGNVNNGDTLLTDFSSEKSTSDEILSEVVDGDRRKSSGK